MSPRIASSTCAANVDREIRMSLAPSPFMKSIIDDKMVVINLFCFTLRRTGDQIELRNGSHDGLSVGRPSPPPRHRLGRPHRILTPPPGAPRAPSRQAAAGDGRPGSADPDVTLALGSLLGPGSLRLRLGRPGQ